MSYRFLSNLRRNELFTYLGAADRARFDRLLSRFAPR